MSPFHGVQINSGYPLATNDNTSSPDIRHHNLRNDKRIGGNKRKKIGERYNKITIRLPYRFASPT